MLYLGCICLVVPATLARYSILPVIRRRTFPPLYLSTAYVFPSDIFPARTFPLILSA